MTRPNIQELLLHAELSALAYKTLHRDVRVGVGELGFTDVDFVEYRDTQLFVAWNAKRVVVSFRGTEKNFTDWLADGDCKLVHGPRGMVHEGFWMALDNVWPQLMKMVNGILHGDRTLSICGHSLGGALATLAASSYLPWEGKVNGVYTYESPRVGNADFATWFDSVYKGRAWRVVNELDVVTRLPPRAMGYRHVDTVCHLDSSGAMTVDPSDWTRLTEWTSSQVLGMWKNVNPFRDITAHSIDAVVKKLKLLESKMS